MKEYYYLIGKDKIGPCSFDELKTKEITKETFVWTEGMENWGKIKDIPELRENFKSILPPPLPIDEIDEENKPIKFNRIEPKLKSKKKTGALTLLICWCSFHLFALLMSYSGVDYFSSGRPKSEDFWPFVKFINTYKEFHETHQYSWGDTGYETEHSSFRGIFAEYDWTEFFFYAGIAFVSYFLIKISKKDLKNNS